MLSSTERACPPAVLLPARENMATYSFDAETSVATVTINDGKMNAFGFDMMSSVRQLSGGLTSRPQR